MACVRWQPQAACRLIHLECVGRVVSKQCHCCRCRYLEQTGCASVCMNSCKVPTQEFFRRHMGMDVALEPNYDDFSCKFVFGQKPLPQVQLLSHDCCRLAVLVPTRASASSRLSEAMQACPSAWSETWPRLFWHHLIRDSFHARRQKPVLSCLTHHLLLRSPLLVLGQSVARSVG